MPKDNTAQRDEIDENRCEFAQKIVNLQYFIKNKKTLAVLWLLGHPLTVIVEIQCSYTFQNVAQSPALFYSREYRWTCSGSTSLQPVRNHNFRFLSTRHLFPFQRAEDGTIRRAANEIARKYILARIVISLHQALLTF